jgi:gas vesicle protein
MNTPTHDGRDHRFAIGLATGTVVGAALALWFAPGLASITKRGRDIKDDVADTIAHGAHEVERYATAARSEPVREAPLRHKVVQRRDA